MGHREPDEMSRVRTRSFADLCLSEPLVRSLRDVGCVHLSPVQLRAIPAFLRGMGKTIPFCSVVLQGIDTANSVTASRANEGDISSGQR